MRSRARKPGRGQKGPRASGAAAADAIRGRGKACQRPPRPARGIFFAMPGERGSGGGGGVLPHPLFCGAGIRKSLVGAVHRSPFPTGFEWFGLQNGRRFGCWPVAFGLMFPRSLLKRFSSSVCTLPSGRVRSRGGLPPWRLWICFWQPGCGLGSCCHCSSRTLTSGRALSQ